MIIRGAAIAASRCVSGFLLVKIIKATTLKRIMRGIDAVK